MIAKTISVPRSKWRKLWAWCLKQSASGKNLVSVYQYDRGGYELKEDLFRVRIGRAHPEVRRVMRFNPETGKDVLAYSTIRWSYVY